MNVSLTPQLEEQVRQRIRSGRYSTASEVIREALRVFERQELMVSNHSGSIWNSREPDRLPNLDR